METRERVWRVIKDCGYTPNQAARTLAGKSVDTLGLFFLLQRDETYDITEDVIVDRMLASVVDSSAKMGFLTLTMIVRNMDEDAMAEIRDIFLQGRINGGVFIGCRKEEPLVEDLVQQGFVVGLLDYPKPAEQENNRVIVNYNPLCGSQAVDYLVSLGHRKIMTVQGDQFRLDGENKSRSFADAMKRHQLDLPDEWRLQSSFYLGESRKAMDDFIDRTPELPTAVFCANDHIAYGVMLALVKKGHPVPEEVSVLGVDDSVISRYIDPPLTTYSVDFAAMLACLTGAVIRRVSGLEEDVFYQEFDNKLVERGSCRNMKA